MILPDGCSYDPEKAVINTITKKNNLGKQAWYDFKRCGLYCIQMAIATLSPTSNDQPPTVYSLSKLLKQRLKAYNDSTDEGSNVDWDDDRSSSASLSNSFS